MIHERSGRNVAKIADGSAIQQRCCNAPFVVFGSMGNALGDGRSAVEAADRQFGIA
jgi:hypothetical protein